ncbi:MAG: hypothetical protein H7A25_05630 [Leptospiraceae bacterium]|nr:hypothetical protein [Leptospiraceae bacterium]
MGWKYVKYKFFLIFSFLFYFSLSAQVGFPGMRYHYQYNMKDHTETRFKEWVPYRLHKWDPKFLEDYYELYGLKMHYGENELRKDIYFLKIGLKSRFRHPRNALCHVKSEEEYHKYRLLLFMHLNLQIMRSYMRIGSLYDKRHLYFYNLDFAHELNKSFQTALSFYKQAKPFWADAKKQALEANKILKDIDLGTLETERYDISTGKLNFEYIIDTHIARLEKKLKTVQEYLRKHPDADKPAIEQGD